LQFARPAWRKELADLDIQWWYTPILHKQRNPTESFMLEQAIGKPAWRKALADLGIQ
jgi:hypothetical protein